MNRFISGSALLMLVCGSAKAASLIGIGDPTSDFWPWDVTGVSDDGTVVVGTASPNPPETIYQAYRWKDGVLTVLGYFSSGDNFRSAAYGVSGDGNVVVGDSPSDNASSEAVRWENGVIQGLGALTTFSRAQAVSADGNVVVGSNAFAAYQWVKNGTSGFLDAGGAAYGGTAYGVSADGNTAVGIANGIEAHRWQAGVKTNLGVCLYTYESTALAVSNDGNVVVGYCQRNAIAVAFRWYNGVMTNLGDLPGGATGSRANDVSADGNVVVGGGTSASGTEAIVWTEAGGMQRLIDVLVAQDATGLDGWILYDACCVSADGSVIVGSGMNPSGRKDVYIARLDPPTVTADIDIQPFDAANEVKPASDNPIIVAVHSTSVAAGDATDFDATQVDPSSLRFGSGEAPNVAVTPWVQDLDGDADSDVMFAFRTQDTGIFCGDTEVTLTGETYAAEPFAGTDAVTTTDCVDTGCHP